MKEMYVNLVRSVFGTLCVIYYEIYSKRLNSNKLSKVVKLSPCVQQAFPRLLALTLPASIV